LAFFCKAKKRSSPPPGHSPSAFGGAEAKKTVRPHPPGLLRTAFGGGQSPYPGGAEQKVVKQTPQVKNKKMCFQNIFRMNNFYFQKILKILQKKKMHDKI
jgi:hypothetical protein